MTTNLEKTWRTRYQKVLDLQANRLEVLAAANGADFSNTLKFKKSVDNMVKKSMESAETHTDLEKTMIKTFQQIASNLLNGELATFNEYYGYDMTVNRAKPKEIAIKGYAVRELAKETKGKTTKYAITDVTGRPITRFMLASEHKMKGWEII